MWAPRARERALAIGDERHALEPRGHGVHLARIDAPHGTDYALLLDGMRLPDPCSRRQPAGLRGPSRVLDTSRLEWTDDGWRRPALGDVVLYELHVGTLPPEGTFEGVIPHLRGLRELGILCAGEIRDGALERLAGALVR